MGRKTKITIPRVNSGDPTRLFGSRSDGRVFGAVFFRGAPNAVRGAPCHRHRCPLQGCCRCRRCFSLLQHLTATQHVMHGQHTMDKPTADMMMPVDRFECVYVCICESVYAYIYMCVCMCWHIYEVLHLHSTAEHSTTISVVISARCYAERVPAVS